MSGVKGLFLANGSWLTIWHNVCKGPPSLTGFSRGLLRIILPQLNSTVQSLWSTSKSLSGSISPKAGIELGFFFKVNLRSLGFLKYLRNKYLRVNKMNEQAFVIS